MNRSASPADAVVVDAGAGEGGAGFIVGETAPRCSPAPDATFRAALSRPLWLAPMAGVTDKAFRTICARHGAGLAFTEMVSAAGLAHAGEKTWSLVDPAPAEPAVVVQLFGHDPQQMASAAVRVERRLGARLAAIDVNMGCPVRKVVRKGEGAALMNTPGLAVKIVAALVEAVFVPVTVKIRAGWQEGEESAPELAQMLERAGAALVGVHGRTARQFYRGNADWGVIRRVKEAVGIPVAGSGDVFSAADAEAMRAQTGCDVVYAARGARGNPWIFEGRKPSDVERVECALEHLGLFCAFYGEEHLSPLRAQLSWYVHGLPGAAAMRRELSAAVTRADFERVFTQARMQVS
jgi:tRNA-dihydrouridine synthase B